MENQLAGEDTSGVWNLNDDPLDATTGTLRGQANITAEERKLREEALGQGQIAQQEALRLSGTDAT